VSESELESYPLAAMKIVFEGRETLLQFSKALLLVDVSDIYLSWFVDITEISEVELLQRISNSLDIRVMMYARSATGLEIAGEGYLHPNLSFHCAAIKGEGELIGYEQIKEAARL
jgi:hypothetical protein